jgi:hypothetical protein
MKWLERNFPVSSEMSGLNSKYNGFLGYLLTACISPSTTSPSRLVARPAQEAGLQILFDLSASNNSQYGFLSEAERVSKHRSLPIMD